MCFSIGAGKMLISKEMLRREIQQEKVGGVPVSVAKEEIVPRMRWRVCIGWLWIMQDFMA